jgi:DNA invertase Pin-like site-specific DNA recombinase
MIKTKPIINHKNHENNNRKNAIAYYRVSSLSQKENTSLENQKNHLQDYALRNSIEIIAEFKDVASGGNINRDGFKQEHHYVKPITL